MTPIPTKSDGCVAQERSTPKRIYKSFYVEAKCSPVNTCEDLNKVMNDLAKFGWTIERIDCHDNVYGIWESDEKRYHSSKDYIIVAYIEQ